MTTLIPTLLCLSDLTVYWLRYSETYDSVFHFSFICSLYACTNIVDKYFILEIVFNNLVISTL